MAFVAAILGLLCFIAVLIEMSTGSLSPTQLLAIGGILLCIAVFLPRTFPNFN